jgi:glycosyltransferase involved in cell wall biosynthesis
MEGCGDCRRIDEIDFEMQSDNTNFMWNVKRDILSQINPHIVVSCNFMKNYLEKSPLTKHFSNIHIIPFGVDITKYSLQQKLSAKRKLGIDEKKTIIGFRAEQNAIKGCQYIYQALERLPDPEKVMLCCVGSGKVPEQIKKKYSVLELGWLEQEEEMVEFLEACDIFLMPSLAESFGLMAIEAMAAGCAVVCFKETVLEEITDAPHCGIAVDYLSADQLGEAIAYLIRHPDETQQRGQIGHEWVAAKYRFEEYVQKHKQLYEQIVDVEGKDYE